MDILPSHTIDWHGNFGLAARSELPTPGHAWPKQFTVRSHLTGTVRTFDLSTVQGVHAGQTSEKDDILEVATYTSGPYRIDVIGE